MPLTRNFKDTVLEKIQANPEFRECLLKEAISELLNGDSHVAKNMLRDFINSTITFKTLAQKTGINDKSLMRMLSDSGNPTLESISLIIKAIEKYEKVHFVVSVKNTRADQSQRL